MPQIFITGNIGYPNFVFDIVVAIDNLFNMTVDLQHIQVMAKGNFITDYEQIRMDRRSIHSSEVHQIFVSCLQAAALKPSGTLIFSLFGVANS